MDPGSAFILLLLLACPMLMFFMHRGGHRDHASHGGSLGDQHSATGETSRSLEELRRRRDELDAEIARREPAETEKKTPAAV